MLIFPRIDKIKNFLNNFWEEILFLECSIKSICFSSDLNFWDFEFLRANKIRKNNKNNSIFSLLLILVLWKVSALKIWKINEILRLKMMIEKMWDKNSWFMYYNQYLMYRREFRRSGPFFLSAFFSSGLKQLRSYCASFSPSLDDLKLSIICSVTVSVTLSRNLGSFLQ